MSIVAVGVAAGVVDPMVIANVPLGKPAVLDTAVVEVAACAAASVSTRRLADSLPTVAPDSADTVTTPELELVGWVASVPPDTSDFSALSNPVSPLFSLARPEICAVSVSDLAVSCLVFTLNELSTSDWTRLPMSMPDPTPSAVVIELVLVVEVVVVIECSARHGYKRPGTPGF